VKEQAARQEVELLELKEELRRTMAAMAQVMIELSLFDNKVS
jgi:hypothetical protein